MKQVVQQNLDQSALRRLLHNYLQDLQPRMTKLHNKSLQLQQNSKFTCDIALVVSFVVYCLVAEINTEYISLLCQFLSVILIHILGLSPSHHPKHVGRIHTVITTTQEISLLLFFTLDLKHLKPLPQVFSTIAISLDTHWTDLTDSQRDRFFLLIGCILVSVLG